MDQLLLFIINNCNFLYKKLGFRFIDSHSSHSFNDAFVTLQSDHLKLRFINERDRITLELQSEFDNGTHWFDIDLIRRMISGISEIKVVTTEEGLDFLLLNIDNIKASLSEKNIKKSVSELIKLRNDRSNFLFN